MDGMRPDPDFTVDQWSDEYRYLSQKASAEPGRWRTSRTPYLREPMQLLSPSSPVQRVVLMAGAQIGKSEMGMCWLGYIMHMAPGPIMAVQPTIDMAKRFSKQRIAPMVEETPVLRGIVAENKSRDDSNTMMAKSFPGGFMILTGANSPTGLRSMPVKYVFADEIDAWPIDAGGEGDPLQLVEKRTTTFSRRKIFVCSTPTVKEISRIEREFLVGDQRRYHVPCPHCDHMQHLRWGQLKWQNDDPATAEYCCESCGALIPEHCKTDMLERGQWVAEAPGDGRTASFHINSLYSPLGWKSWSDIVSEFMQAKGDASLLKTWVNTVLGESFDDAQSARLGAGDIKSRVEFYTPNVAPACALAITAAVDVQDDRLEVSLWGWGRDEEGWVIDHMAIYGDPSQPKVWAQLDEVILKPVAHELAEPLKIAATAIDSGGHFTHEVYAYCRDRKAHHVFAIKGQSQRGKPAIGKAAKVDLNWKGRTLKSGAEVHPVGSDTIKSTLYARLKLNEPGPGYLHFHAELPADYFDQLTAERQVTKYIKGFPIREWVKRSGARNEALDCLVYAYAALQWLSTKYNRRTMWDQLERSLNITAKTEAPKQQQPTNKSRQGTIKRSNFMTSW